jgi:outer membrane protein OmpA-like peptidoglycan-associated protein
MHARTASGVLLALGFADLCALNLLLAPRLSPVTMGPQAAPNPAPPAAALRSADSESVQGSASRPEPPWVRPAPVATPSPPAPKATATAERAAGPDLLFEFGTLRFTSALAADELKRVASELRADPSRRALVRGHTDRLGAPSHNMELSRQRAEHVARLLVIYGAPADRIAIEARGDSEPATAGDKPTDWARNRRVQILIR